jgi:hypothetical protein
VSDNDRSAVAAPPDVPAPTPARDEATLRVRSVPNANPLVTAPWVLGPLIAVGAVAYALAPRIAWRLDRYLPAAATVRSRGTNFPGILDAAPFTIRSTAILLVGAALIALLAPRVHVNVRPTRRAAIVTMAALAVVAGAVYWWFGYPHNGLPANSYIHWVDISFTRAHTYWYVLVKPAHRLFYDRPYLLQAINGALNVTLVYLIGRSLYRRGFMPVAMAAALLVSSLVLTFADTAEDVQLTIAALLCATLAIARRSTPWTGVALFVVVLARPELGYLWIAWGTAEWLVRDRDDARTIVARTKAVLHDRYVVVNGAIALGLFVVWDAILVARGDNWLFKNGKVLDTHLVDLKPITTDGFTISRLSGAYVLHALWVFPTIWLIAIAVALWRQRELPLVARRLLVFCVLVVVGGIAVSELQPLFYFNVRYLSYLLPFLLLGAFTVPLLPSRGRRPWFGPAALATMLLLAGTTTHWEAFRTHDRLTAAPVAQTFGARFELRRIVGDAPLSTMSPALTTRRYLAYIFHRQARDIRPVGFDDLPSRGFVYTSPESLPPGAVVWRDDHAALVKLGKAG